MSSRIVVKVYFSEDERQLVQEYADSVHRPVSTVMREMILARIKRRERAQRTQKEKSINLVES